MASFFMVKIHMKKSRFSLITICTNLFRGLPKKLKLRHFEISPDGRHSISVVALRDGTLLLTNEAKTPYTFSISRDRRVMATVQCVPDTSNLIINTNWRINDNGVQNPEILANPDIIMSPKLNIDLDYDGFGRVDLKIDNSGFACCVMNEKYLLFVRMNGNHVFPKLVESIRGQIESAPTSFERVMDFWISTKMNQQQSESGSLRNGP